MIGNDTCPPGNGTTCLPPPHNVALPVGLTVLFLLIVIVAGALIYRYCRKSKSRNFLQPEQRSQKEEGCSEILQADSHQYITASRQQPTSQTPIYENLTSHAVKYNRCSENQSRLSTQPEEDLYLQCDLPDDAIYSNDPACRLTCHSYSQEEDVYIVPDS